MKRLMLLTLAACVSLASAFAAPSASAGRYTHSYDFRDFNKLAVASSFKVELSIEDSYEVSIDVPDFIEPYLKISKRGDAVRIGLKQMPNEIRRKLSKDNSLKARVTMPKLLDLEQSGATTVNFEGFLELGAEDLHIDLSGASHLNSFRAKGKGKCDIDLSGASKAGIEASFGKVAADVSGASHLNLAGDSVQLALEGSGASTIDIDGSIAKAQVNISGASKGTVAGDIPQLSLEVSGASRFNVEGTVGRADVDLSGASSAHLAVTEKLDYEISGVSTLNVQDLGARIKGETSRGSKLRYIK